MNDTIAMLVLAAVLGAVIAFHLYEAKAWRAERADLLSRIMAKTYTDYVYTQPQPTAADETPQLLTDAAEAKFHAEHIVATMAADTEWHRQNYADHPEQYPDGLPSVAAA